MRKSIFLAPLVGCVLAACGGGGSSSNPPQTPTSASVGGTVSGMPGGTLLLKNAGAETIAVTGNGSFAFTKRVTEGNAYNVTVFGVPAGTNCVVSNGAGTVAHGVDSVSNVNATCTSGLAIAMFQFYVGVTVSGLLPGNSVSVMNNGNETLTATENGLFVFPTEYFEEGFYSQRAGGYQVTVNTTPANQSCTVTNGSGALTDGLSNFVNVTVTCK
jgi:hypothetical protein